MGIFDKAKDLASQNPDQANAAVDKLGDLVDERTGGKFAGQVDQAQDMARAQFGGQAPAEEPPVVPQDTHHGVEENPMPGQPGNYDDAPGQPMPGEFQDVRGEEGAEGEGFQPEGEPQQEF